MRRRPGSLIPLEVDICVCAATLRQAGAEEFHGYALAAALQREHGTRTLTAYGTLYRALGRLEAMGLLKSRWEDPQAALSEGRPARRLYALTADGEAAAGAQPSRSPAVQTPRWRRKKLAPA